MAAFCQGCKAIVHWPKTPLGEAMPPIDHVASEDGTVLIERDGHGVLRGTVPEGQTKAALPAGTKLFKIHHCDPEKVKAVQKQRAHRRASR